MKKARCPVIDTGQVAPFRVNFVYVDLTVSETALPVLTIL
jgi:hypothetical protein